MEKYRSSKQQTIIHLGVLAVYEEGLRAVGDEDNELRHLQLGQVLLPPQVALHPGAQRCVDRYR